jgi:pimeloyl-ACP methyl ester carboxylesterase
VKEAAYKPVPPAELSVYDSQHPRPKDELDAKKLRAVMTKASDEQIAKLAPKDAASLKEYQRVVGTALRVMVNSELPKEIAVRVEPVKATVDGLTVYRAAIGRTDEKDALPGCGVTGEKYTGEKAVVWLHPQGKAGLFPGGKAAPAVKALTADGFGVLAPDLLGTGENAFPKPFPVDKGFAGFTYGYNRTLLANRVHDALTLIAFARTLLKAKTVHLVGWDEFGVVAVLAKALAGDAVAKTAADLNQFGFEKIEKTDDPMMLPGAVKYGGLGAFLALCAPGEVLVHNQMGSGTGQLSRAAYEAAGAANKLTRSAEKLDAAKVVEWLVK